MSINNAVRTRNRSIKNNQTKQITRDDQRRVSEKELVEMELISLDETVRHVMRGMRSRDACLELSGGHVIREARSRDKR